MRREFVFSRAACFFFCSFRERGRERERKGLYATEKSGRLVGLLGWVEQQGGDEARSLCSVVPRLLILIISARAN